MTPSLARVADYLAAAVRAHRSDPDDQRAAVCLWLLLTDEERAVVAEWGK